MEWHLSKGALEEKTTRRRAQWTWPTRIRIASKAALSDDSAKEIFGEAWNQALIWRTTIDELVTFVGCVNEGEGGGQ